MDSSKTRQPRMPAWEVHDLTVTYNKRPVLWGVDFVMDPGKIACIIGPNGAGKSTLVKAAMGLVSPASGYVNIFGRRLDTVRRRVSYVPQKESVDWEFPISVQEVVMMGRIAYQGFFKRAGTQDKAIVAESLQKVGMESLSGRQISQLSGGQQQRVFLARALAQQADFYFLDEPFAGVDVATEQAIMALLKQMSAEGKTIVVVHHDLQTAPVYFDYVVMLNGRLVTAGPMDECFTSENLNQTYGGRLNILTSVGELVAQSDIRLRKGN